ncbi:hypothetical protein BD779DRAFT_398444 [Infundibulicybe gibba]|nr:hypothetical protein BD779DRAFT_398444 [Infundibulicybe gibba]
MRAFTAVFLSFAASTWAYQVLTPNQSSGWTNSGPQPLTWERVNTDRDNFTVVLTNMDRAAMPNGDQVLAAQVVGSTLKTTLNPPSAGWPTGGGFRVNLVASPTELSTILAQSPQFNITPPTGSSSLVYILLNNHFLTPYDSSVRPSSTIANTGANANTGSSNTNTASNSGTTDTTDGTAPPTGAGFANGVQVGLVSVATLVGFFLA